MRTIFLWSLVLVIGLILMELVERAIWYRVRLLQARKNLRDSITAGACFFVIMVSGLVGLVIRCLRGWWQKSVLPPRLAWRSFVKNTSDPELQPFEFVEELGVLALRLLAWSVFYGLPTQVFAELSEAKRIYLIFASAASADDLFSGVTAESRVLLARQRKSAET